MSFLKPNIGFYAPGGEFHAEVMEETPIPIMSLEKQRHGRNFESGSQGVHSPYHEGPSPLKVAVF